MKILKNAMSAVSFLTIIPVRSGDSARDMLIFFPFAGLIVGLVASFAFALAEDNVVLSAFSIFLWVLVTGGFHLDGLADTFDALAFAKNRQERLRIMKDVHLGSFGVTAIVVAILMKFSLLQGIKPKFVFLILSTVCARWLLVLLAYFSDAVKNSGLGWWICSLIDRDSVVYSTIVCFFCVVFIAGFWLSIFVMFFVFIFSYMLSVLWDRLFGGVTGDIFGASCEMCEILVLLIGYMWR